MTEADFGLCGLVTDDKAAFVPAGTFRAFEMPDDSMYPRIKRGAFSIIEHDGCGHADIDDDVLVQLTDGRWQVRRLAGHSCSTVTLATYNPPTTITVARSDIAAIYYVDLTVPHYRLALLTSASERVQQ